jgi:hypothetical protein
MSTTVTKLKSTFKAFENLLTDFLSTLEHMEKFNSVSQHLLINCDYCHVEYYLKEFYIRVAYLFDIQDTLEFGRLRTNSQSMIHSAFIEPNKLGCYMALPHDSDKNLQLTSCSHEGIQYHLNLLEVRNI